jgi:hypothetical protein
MGCACRAIDRVDQKAIRVSKNARDQEAHDHEAENEPHVSYQWDAAGFEARGLP